MFWFTECVKKYCVFSGRARRKEFWMFFLFYAVFGLIAAFLDSLLGMQNFVIKGFCSCGIIYLLYSLALLLPSLGAAVRRLHDTGRNGWWLLILLIPLAGPVWLFVLLCLDSSVGGNRYGPNPKYTK